MRIFKKGEETELSTEIDGLRDTVHHAKMPAHIEKVALKEVERLSKTSPSAAEYTIGINYIDYLVSLPWHRMTEDNLDITRAKSILDEEHYGLKEIKDRILEHLAVRILKLSRRHRILVVDDEEMTCKNLDHVLTKDGFEVKTAASGIEALNILEKSSFDVIVTDLKMENVDGMGVLGKAKEKDPSTEVIVITGYATVPTAVEAMKKGSYNYLAKPFKLEEIRSTVQRALSKKKAQLEARGPILCFVGPPGTGKTSLGMSIARSLERKFVRISLAGMKDEAEIRGHRRSYVGALPGRIIQEIRRVESKNPVFMLDEIDKIGQDFKGDPASALLEVLDPEQNHAFNDHYLEVDFDLSEVMFVATANTLDIPAALLDRMEVIRLAGYIEDEKLRIAERHIVPKQREKHGLSDAELILGEASLRQVIQSYTREAGVRNLEREIAKICRKVVKRLALDSTLTGIEVTPENLADFLGVPRFRHELAEQDDAVGRVTGLAWTEVGGELLTIETAVVPGKGKLIHTGSLGEVMQESIQAALTVVRSRAASLGIDSEFYQKSDIHLHMPEGAIPKDGPSAGVGMVTALVSALTSIPVRSSVAMTGEITLRGEILAIGGLKEKLIAAHRGGIKTVLIPHENAKDLVEIPENVKSDLQIIPVRWIEEVLERALSRLPLPIEAAADAAVPIKEGKEAAGESALRSH